MSFLVTRINVIARGPAEIRDEKRAKNKQGGHLSIAAGIVFDVSYLLSAS